MKSNLTQWSSITQSLPRGVPCTPSPSVSSAGEQPSCDEYADASLVNDNETEFKLKTDMDYVLKELEQIRKDIKDVRAEARIIDESSCGL